ncbi:ankyrin repeat-containing domain protein [Mycena floridula]|nr:ankyrin repeat-containing domain protein [Mycena floridula]
MTTVQPDSAQNTSDDPTSLPDDTLAFAERMFSAARDGGDSSQVLLAAIDAGLPVNLTNHKGNTLLMLAAYAGHTELANALLSRGADPNRLNDLGQAIVAGAVFKGHDDIVRALMAKGADPRQGTPTAIQTAHMFNKKEVLQVLGAKEGDIGPDVPTPLGRPTA